MHLEAAQDTPADKAQGFREREMLASHEPLKSSAESLTLMFPEEGLTCMQFHGASSP